MEEQDEFSESFGLVNPRIVLQLFNLIYHNLGRISDVEFPGASFSNVRLVTVAENIMSVQLVLRDFFKRLFVDRARDIATQLEAVANHLCDVILERWPATETEVDMVLAMSAMLVELSLYCESMRMDVSENFFIQLWHDRVGRRFGRAISLISGSFQSGDPHTNQYYENYRELEHHIHELPSPYYSVPVHHLSSLQETFHHLNGVMRRVFDFPCDVGVQSCAHVSALREQAVSVHTDQPVDADPRTELLSPRFHRIPARFRTQYLLILREHGHSDDENDDSSPPETEEPSTSSTDVQSPSSTQFLQVSRDEFDFLSRGVAQAPSGAYYQILSEEEASSSLPEDRPRVKYPSSRVSLVRVPSSDAQDLSSDAQDLSSDAQDLSSDAQGLSSDVKDLSAEAPSQSAEAQSQSVEPDPSAPVPDPSPPVPDPSAQDELHPLRKESPSRDRDRDRNRRQKKGKTVQDPPAQDELRPLEREGRSRAKGEGLRLKKEKKVPDPPAQVQGPTAQDPSVQVQGPSTQVQDTTAQVQDTPAQEELHPLRGYGRIRARRGRQYKQEK